ncbi:AAR2 protein-domain-containing protein [Hypoxylon cercidicola]|nr:AAR2 protein-domain-containing protein [Hypoxylon cercidicola]
MSPATESSKPEVTPQGDKSRPDFCGVAVEAHPPSTPDPIGSTNTSFSSSSNRLSANPPRPYPLTSFNSVEAVPTIGTLPLRSLRVTNDPDVYTPLTTPDRSRPSTGSGSRSRPSTGTGIMTPQGGDVLLLDDLPAGFTVGCDAASFGTSPSQPPFPGFRDVPAGAHLFWVSPSESSSARTGCWIVTPPRGPREPASVYVKQWDAYDEVLGEPATHAEERFQKERLRQVFDGLLPSQQIQPRPPLSPRSARTAPDGDGLPPFLDEGGTSIWSQLTAAIHPALLDRIAGKPPGTTARGNGWQVTTSDRVAGEPTLAREARLYGGDAQPPLRFTFAMDALLVSPAATGERRTRQALDPTEYILEALETRPNPFSSSDLVGELSFAFLTGTHLGNHSLLEQWWFYLTRVVFRSYALAAQRPRLARSLIQAFHAQLVYDELHLAGASVLETFPEHARALEHALVTYRGRLDELLLLGDGDGAPPAQRAVGAAFAALEAWLSRKGWDLRADYVRAGGLMLEDGEVVEAELSDFEDEDERGEFAPALVELDEFGRETGLVSWNA